MTIAEYLAEHWITLTSSLGVGAGAGLGAKKLTDAQQNKKIEQHERDISEIKTKLEVNTRLDAERQAALSVHLDKIDKRFDRMDDKLDRILENQNKRTR
jgi:ABC-type phosphate transport system auxiliary subunit